MNKIALIGLGSIGKKHLANLKTLYPKCEVLVCSPSGRRYPDSDSYVVKNDIEEIISSAPDAAIIATPAPFHLASIRQFQAENIPVLVEKPLCAELSELTEQPVADNRLAVAYCLRYLPAAAILKAFLASGEAGRIYNVHASVGQYLPDWRKDKSYRDSVSASKKLGGGALLELSHEIDMINFLFGELTFQYAYLRTNQQLGLEVEEIADVMLLSQSHILCHVHLDFIQKKPSREITIIAEKGTVTWDVIKNRVTFVNADEVRVLLDDGAYDKNEMYLNMIADFENMISGRQNQCVTLGEAQEVIALIDEIKKKAIWS